MLAASAAHLFNNCLIQLLFFDIFNVPGIPDDKNLCKSDKENPKALKTYRQYDSSPSAVSPSSTDIAFLTQSTRFGKLFAKLKMNDFGFWPWMGADGALP